MITSDAARFGTASIRRWWNEMGVLRFPRARKLMITADGGGSNSSRSGLWKVELQNLTNELGIPIQICHFPPGTSKWNKIEHRLFSFMTQSSDRQNEIRNRNQSHLPATECRPNKEIRYSRSMELTQSSHYGNSQPILARAPAYDQGWVQCLLP